MPRKTRNYRREYDEYHSRPEQRKRRAQRNKARRQAIREGRVKKGDGREVHHTQASARSLGKGTRVTSRTENRRIGPGKRRRRAAARKGTRVG